jgi:hypothetical protein
VHDLRYGLKMLAKAPSFTTIAVVTLALGIGVNATIFTIFDAVALRPLPVRSAGSLMRLERWFASGRVGSAQYLFSWQEYTYLQARSHSFPELIAVSDRFSVPASLPADPGGQMTASVRIAGELVSANDFTQLLPSLAVGRALAPDETRMPGQAAVLVLSYPFWQRKCGGDPAIVGKSIALNGVPFTVVGVAPPEFIGTANPPVVPDFWAPVTMEAQPARAASAR